MVEGVLLGPGAGGGVVPALPELDQSGAGVFDSGMECVRVLPGSVAGATSGVSGPRLNSLTAKLRIREFSSLSIFDTRSAD